MPRAKERKITKVAMKRLKNAKANKLNQNPITAVTPYLFISIYYFTPINIFIISTLFPP